MKKLAVIDMGTNSLRLMLADVSEGNLLSCKKELITTRLGKDVNKNGFLSEDAMDRSIDALKTFVSRIDSEGAELIGVIATSAVRDSSNRDLFATRVKDEVGIEINIISGEEEAELAYIGVLLSAYGGDKLSPKDNIAIIDIGGGSTEVIIGDAEGIKYSHSFDLGSVRLTEMFINSDPPSVDELENIRSYIRDIAGELGKIVFMYNPKCIIGIAGTITTLAAISLELEEFHRDLIEGYNINKEELERLTKILSSLSVEEKKNLKGLQPQRADIIASGVVLLDTLVEIMGMNSLLVSDFDNLEGVLIKRNYVNMA